MSSLKQSVPVRIFCAGLVVFLFVVLSVIKKWHPGENKAIRLKISENFTWKTPDPRKLINILVQNGKPGIFEEWRIIEGDHHFRKCPVKQCTVSEKFNAGSFTKADIVIFSHHFGFPTFHRPPGQIWVVMFWEPPMSSAPLRPFKGLVNWTVTYRRDSTMFIPYGIVIPKNKSVLAQKQKKNYASGRSKKVAWIVSHCHGFHSSRTLRELYAKQLQKHISVDIFGACGPFKCPRSEMDSCMKMLKKQYKFYLAFENSQCRDYITEKLFRNSLINDLLPIVMGPPQEDYDMLAPHQSYLHVDNFTSPKHLAEYLHLLDKNDDLYNKYFQWKGTADVVERIPSLPSFWCEFCAMAWRGGKLQWYDDIEDWWRGNGVCIPPLKRWDDTLHRELPALAGDVYVP